MKCFIKYSFIVLIVIVSFSCRKDWLDAKPRQVLTVPNTLKDLRALLDNTSVFNIDHPFLTELGADNYYLNNADYGGRDDLDINSYSWAPLVQNFYGTNPVKDWEIAYTAIFYANSVLENVEEIPLTSSTAVEWKEVKGAALFHRAYAFYNLSQVFCKPYVPSSANSDPGIILRLESDVNIPSHRSTVKETYGQILADLLISNTLLPHTTMYPTRPSKYAALAMLARVYLSMQDYDNAWLYADSCLQGFSALMNYSTDPAIDRGATSQYAILTRYNPEVIFFARLGNNTLIPNMANRGFVDSTLYSLYHTNDWRKSVFFEPRSGRLAFGGSYYGSVFMFSGLATDEMYLIRAECNARKNKKTEALNDLNALLVKRWKTNTFTHIDTPTADAALQVILQERRKELCFRGIRWTDLRRLNQDPRFAVTLKRGLLGSTTLFTLPPNSDRYVYPIPDSEILFSGVPQNPR